MATKTYYYLCLIFGVFLVFYQEFQAEPKLIIQIGSLLLLMFSLYHLSKGIPERSNSNSFIENEEEE